MAELKIGIGLPTMGEIETLGIGWIGAAARHVEELGLESVWAPDLSVGDGTPSLESTIARPDETTERRDLTDDDLSGALRQTFGIVLGPDELARLRSST